MTNERRGRIRFGDFISADEAHLMWTADKGARARGYFEPDLSGELGAAVEMHSGGEVTFEEVETGKRYTLVNTKVTREPSGWLAFSSAQQPKQTP